MRGRFRPHPSSNDGHGDFIIVFSHRHFPWDRNDTRDLVPVSRFYRRLSNVKWSDLQAFKSLLRVVLEGTKPTKFVLKSVGGTLRFSFGTQRSFIKEQGKSAVRITFTSGVERFSDELFVDQTCLLLAYQSIPLELSRVS